MSTPINGFPSLIREILYAPPCPPSVALLFEVALTHHNSRNYETSINTYMQGLQEWERIMKKENFPELEQAQNISFTERVKREEALRGKSKRYQREQLSKMDMSGNGNGSEVSALSPEGKEPPIDAHSDALFDDSEYEAEKARQGEEDEERRKELVQALHSAHDSISIEGKIFLRLVVGSVLESAAMDERALAEYLQALRLCQTSVPSYSTNLMTATVYSCLGVVYCHLSQYDFAADYCFRALEIREQQLTDRHVDVGLLLNNIGVLLYMLDRPSDALTMMYRAETIFQDQFHASHPRLLLTKQNIRKTKNVFLKDAKFPPVPFTPIHPPVWPGVERAKKAYMPKAKKKKADDKKKK